jgi:nucleoid-associated protein YgaU
MTIPQNPVGGNPGTVPGNGQLKIHTVQAGDWLSKIAMTYYGDMNGWPEIHEKNKNVIGPDPNLIKPGQKLVIP